MDAYMYDISIVYLSMIYVSLYVSYVCMYRGAGDDMDGMGAYFNYICLIKACNCVDFFQFERENRDDDLDGMGGLLEDGSEYIYMYIIT